MEDPHVVMRIDSGSTDLSVHPFIRQRLRPERIRLESRHLRPARLPIRMLLDKRNRNYGDNQYAKHPDFASHELLLSDQECAHYSGSSD